MGYKIYKIILPLLSAGLLVVIPIATVFAKGENETEVKIETEIITETVTEVEPDTLEIVETELLQPQEIIPQTEFPSSEEIKYGVTLSWLTGKGYSEINYEKIWNPDTHSYDSWKSTENYITVTNTSAEGKSVLVTLDFISDAGGTRVSLSPSREEQIPEDFRESSDGQLTFALPRPSGENSVDIYLWPEALWTEEYTGDYRQMGAVRVILEEEGTLTSLDEKKWEIPVMPEWEEIK